MFALAHLLFCVAFSKATARRAGEKTAFSFCQAFSFVPLASKEKALQRRTNLRYQSSLAAFFDSIGAKKANTETPSALSTATPKAHIHSLQGPPAPRGSATRRAVAF